MPTEHTQLKNAIQAGDSNSTDEPVVIGKDKTYQRLILIVTGSFLALLVWIAVESNNGGHYFKSSAQEIAKGAGALVDYQLDSANLALTQDIFHVNAVSKNENSCLLCPFWDCCPLFCC
mmetsp:Transcript_45498/g.52553  ORF Transcript_45498/g.52553 Transcript_45498/m.52553 type:complete len:119 (-) Transcript_45498:58-414(-)